MKKLLLLITAVLAAGAEAAQAGPAVPLFTVFAGGVAYTFALPSLVVGLLANAAATALAKSFAKKPGIDVSLETEYGDATPLAFTVGTYATAGKQKYSGSWGRNTRYHVRVIEISCLPQGLSGVWVDDEKAAYLADDYAHAFVSESWTPGAVRDLAWQASATPGAGQIYVGHSLATYRDNADSIQPRIWVKHYDGTQTEADPYLLWAFGDDPDYPWTADHIGTGKSYVILTTQYDGDTLTSYPNYLWEPAPLAMYDPRSDSTAGGSGPMRWGDRSTYLPTQNAAVIAYNIARGICLGDEWIFGGRDLAAWRLPFAEWVAAMNACGAPVALSGGGTEQACRAGAEITVDMDPRDVIDEIGHAANMRFAEVGGMLKPLVDIPAAAVLSITDEDILITEGQSYRPFVAVSETFNALSATYPEPAEKWTSKDAPEYVDADATADDGGRYLPTSVRYNAAPYARQVQRLMRAQMRAYRRMRQHQFYLPPMAYALEPLDMISWTSARNGYVAKLFIVERLQKTAGMCVAVTLREVDPDDYSWSSDYERPFTPIAPVNPAPPSQPVDGFAAVAITLVDGAGRPRRPAIRLSWASGIAARGIRWQLRLQGTTEVALRGSTQDVSAGTYVIDGVLPATDYEVRARLITGWPTEWSGWIAVTTDDVRVGAIDLAYEVQAAIDAAQARADEAAAAADEVQGNLDAAVAPLRVDIDAAQAELEA
ncbi:phage tail protein, partial [Rhodobacter maris]